MIADVILGITIDTQMWITDLKEQKSENIFVIDYEYFGEPKASEGVLYLSPLEAKKYFERFDSIFFYKAMYAYPGMSGKMSSLYKK